MLAHLPDEALVCVFSFIKARDLIVNLSLVCKRFRLIISSDWYWKRRFSVSCGEQIELRNVDPIIRDLQINCIQGEYVRFVCDDKLGYMKLDTLSASTGGIDCVQILSPDMTGTKMLLAAGSRDHLIYLWRKRSMDESVRSMREYITTELDGHRGWVWCLASNKDSPNLLCSGSWDHDVRLWDIGIGQCVLHIHKEHKAAVLSLALPEHDVLLSGGFDKNIRRFDIRDKSHRGEVCGTHVKSVLSVVSDNNYIYSGSDDKTIRLWDVRRLGEEIRKVKHQSSVTSMCLNHGILSATVGKNVHFLNISQGQLEPKAEFDPGHATPLTSVYHDMGMIVTGSKDHSARIHTMTVPHQCLKIFPHLADVTDVHFRLGALAVGSSDRTVSLWFPKSLF